MDASAELRAVLDAARLRAEGVFSPVSGEGEDKLVETTVSAEVNLAPCSLRDLVAWADAELCAAGGSNESEPVLPPSQSELGKWALGQWGSGEARAVRELGNRPVGQWGCGTAGKWGSGKREMGNHT